MFKNLKPTRIEDLSTRGAELSEAGLRLVSGGMRGNTVCVSYEKGPRSLDLDYYA